MPETVKEKSEYKPPIIKHMNVSHLMDNIYPESEEDLKLIIAALVMMEQEMNNIEQF